MSQTQNNHINLGVKSAVARLLAQENIQVNQTNSSTAYFNIDTRVLNLPLWDVPLYVYDMLVAHEIGHALFTPATGWHDSVIELEIPRSYINVVEDARIEKNTKRKYPGIVYTFSRAYQWMNDNDFFKINGRGLDTFKLIDRINIHFKLGHCITVPFLPEEIKFVNMVGECETFEEVIEVCEQIKKFTDENKDDFQEALENLFKKIQDDAIKENANSSDYYGDSDDEEEESGKVIESYAENTDGKLDYGDNIPDHIESNVESQRLKNPFIDSPVGDFEYTDPIETEDSETDMAFRSNELKMVSNEKGSILKFFPESELEHCVVDYKVYHDAPRDEYCSYQCPGYTHGYPRDVDINKYKEYCLESYKKFTYDTNKIVGYLAKQFEQKKAAYQYTRAKVSNSGVLNTSALHKYKFSEDIFKRITTLADAKSHGMFIGIDMSGSMGGKVIFDTIRQALNLALFCRRVAIPFEMYGYTDGYVKNPLEPVWPRAEIWPEGTIVPVGLKLIQFFTTKMSKRNFENAVKSTYMFGCGIANKFDNLNSTPTNEALIAFKYLIKKFKKDSGVQKIINVLLTDGEAGKVTNFKHDYAYNGNMLQISNNKVIRLNNTSRHLSEVLLNHIREECGTINLGYFLGDAGILRRTLYNTTNNDHYAFKKAQTECRKNGGYVTDNIFGYDRYIVLNINNLKIQEDDFEVDEDASKATLTREFVKFTKGRLSSRVLLDRLVQIVV